LRFLSETGDILSEILTANLSERRVKNLLKKTKVSGDEVTTSFGLTVSKKREEANQCAASFGSHTREGERKETRHTVVVDKARGRGRSRVGPEEEDAGGVSRWESPLESGDSAVRTCR